MKSPGTCPRLSDSAFSTAQRAIGDHSTNCFSITPWSASYTAYPNLLMLAASFSKAL